MNLVHDFLKSNDFSIIVTNEYVMSILVLFYCRLLAVAFSAPFSLVNQV